MALASLCVRAKRAESGSDTSAQRTAGLRLAAIEMPIPLPHKRDAALGLARGELLGQRVAEIGIIDRGLAVGAEVGDFVPELGAATRQARFSARKRRDRKRWRSSWPAT